MPCHAPVLVYALDGSLVASNALARVVLAAKRASQVTHVNEIPFSDDQKAAIEQAFSGKPNVEPQPNPRRMWLATINGYVRQLLFTTVPVADFTPGRCGAVVVLDDVTEFAHLDELQSERMGAGERGCSSKNVMISRLEEDPI